MLEGAVPALRGLASFTERGGQLREPDEVWQRRRAEAFALLDEARVLRAYRLATLILRDPDGAEDAVQEAIVKAWASWASLRQPDRFDAWFDRILVNVCRNMLRRAHAIRFVPIEAASEWSATDQSAEVDERLAFERAFERLSPDQRIVLVLRIYLDLTVEAIAERLGVPRGTVKSRLHYGLQAVREEIER